jgi:hypothetical protein
MKNKLYDLSFSSALIKRGFWLYVWEVKTNAGDIWLYVGRTGDSSTCNAQSPFIRLGQHLGHNENANALRRNLINNKIVAEECSKFQLFAYGPIYPEIQDGDKSKHNFYRDLMSALEKKLQISLSDAGYNVLNIVTSKKELNQSKWIEVRNAFSKKFPKLKAIN